MSTFDLPWPEHLRSWLDACLDAADPALLLTMPAEAAAAAGREGEVYRVVRDWAKAGGAERTTLARSLLGLVERHQERTAG